ncbi:T9SS type A sorting domain-containing protein [Bacteroides salyersiae]
MQNVNIYPTIIDNSTTVSVAEGAFSVEFVSITGVSVLKVNSSGNVLNLEGLDMASGMYLVKIVQDNNVLSVKRVIKL